MIGLQVIIVISLSEFHFVQTILTESRMNSTCSHSLAAKLPFEQPVIITSSDKIMIIRGVKPKDRPQVEITDATFDQLVGMA